MYRTSEKKVCEHCGRIGCRPEYHVARCGHCGGIGAIQHMTMAWPDGRVIETWLHSHCESGFIAKAERAQ
jgi:hypothetical protein